MTVTCPKCFAPAKVPAAAAGKRVRCKTCGGAFRATAEPAAPAAPPAPAAARKTGAKSAAPRRSPRRARRSAGRSPGAARAVRKWAAAGVAVAAVSLAAAWLVPRVPQLRDAAEAVGLPGGRVPGVGGPAFGADPPSRERLAASERWEAGVGTTLTGANAELRKRGGPDFDIGPNAPPPKDPAKEREAGERSVSRYDATVRGEMRHSASTTFTQDGVTRTFAVGPSVGGGGGGGFGGGPGAFQAPDGPAVAVRVRRRRWEGYTALGGLELLTDRRAADDVLPGESADAAPPGHVFAGLDAAVGHYVYAVRPLWAPAGGRLDGSAQVVEGEWLGEKGNWPVARLRPDGRRLAGVTARRGGLLDSVALLMTGEVPAKPAGERAPGEAASVFRSDGS